MNNAPIKVGFWRSEREPQLPVPYADRVDPEFHPQFVLRLKKLESTLRPTVYRGISLCRICGVSVGNSEFEHEGFVWPGGYSHYIAEHGLNPPDDFYKMVLAATPGIDDGLPLAVITATPKTELDMPQLADLVMTAMLKRVSKFAVLASSQLAAAAHLKQPALTSVQQQLLQAHLRSRGMELIQSRKHVNQFILVSMRDAELAERLILGGTNDQ